MIDARADQSRPGPLPRWFWALLLALLIAFGWLQGSHPVGRFTHGGLVHGDGVYYYAYTRSLLVDGDVDFENDYALLDNPHARGRGPTGRLENRFTIGPTLLWAPGFLVARGLALSGVWDDEPGDGSGRRVQRIALSASLLAAFAAIALAVAIARHHVRDRFACAAGLAVLVASPLAWYAIYQPSWPHAASAAAVALFLWTWHKGHVEKRRGQLGWLALGLALGLAALMRPQNVLWGLLPAVELAGGALLAARRRDRGALLAAASATAALALGLTLGFLPQALAWKALYGAYLTIPQGEAFLRWDASRWTEVLYSSRNGLFSWSPITYLGALGLVYGLARRRGSTRALAGLLLLALLLQVHVNGSVDDWWGGWAFGGRRFVGFTAGFVVGLALLLAALDGLLRRRAEWVFHGLPALLLASLAICNLERMDAYLTGRYPRGGSQSMRDRDVDGSGRLLAGLYDHLGYPGSIPANWLFALRAGVSPERYDQVSGWELVNGRGNDRGWDVITLPDERWSMAGFSAATIIDQQPCAVIVEEVGIVALPLRAPLDLDVTALLRPSVSGARLTIELGGAPVLEETLTGGWTVYRFTIPASALQAGINLARLRVDAPPPPAPETLDLSIGSTGVRSPLELAIVSDPTSEDAAVLMELGEARFTTIARGVTAAVLRPGEAPRPVTYDTFADGQADRFAADLGALPSGTVVALALAGEARRRWTPAASEAVRGLGGRMQLRATTDPLAYALVGVTGADPGAGVERVARGKAAEVTVGRSRGARLHGVAIAWIALARRGVTPELPALPPSP